ncbi:hypothetical protein [Winogradskyella pulchriflava]|uniref:Uncharacterized protein n=1 Tax=Winogradskyella pulchriflava TaxID=1110688 RepID=A0ABV6Q7K6_9FLAO
MENLIKKISRPIIFYLPRAVIEKVSGKDLKALDDIGMTNTLFSIDTEGNTKQITNVIEPIFLLGKDQLLKASVFELLKMKGSLEKDTFYFLLDNYLIELDTWINTTNIIKESAIKDTHNYSSPIQAYLDMQHRFLVEHKNELKSHFGYWKMSIELERVFNLAPPTEEQLDAYNKRESTGITKKENNKNNKIKPKLITEKEVDIYLLQTVFNVDLKAKNNKN